MAQNMDVSAETVPPLGILMLETAFHRPPGDVGNSDTWPFPVLFATVPGATARRVVDGDAGLLEPFVAAAEGLVRRGAAALITSCGFLAALQPALAARVPVPVATSALLQLPMLAGMLPPGTRPGVLTYDAAAFTAAHLRGVGAAADTPVAGLPSGGALRGVIERGEPYDHDALAAEVVEAASRLLAADPSVGALVLECTNLPPFAAALRQRFRLPVFDVVTLGCALHAAAAGRGFSGAG